MAHTVVIRPAAAEPPFDPDGLHVESANHAAMVTRGQVNAPHQDLVIVGLPAGS
jgi:hypothetical protein